MLVEGLDGAEKQASISQEVQRLALRQIHADRVIVPAQEEFSYISDLSDSETTLYSVTQT